MILLLAFASAVLAFPPAQASEGADWVLAPILVEGTPAEALSQDPIFRGLEGELHGPVGSGELGRAFQDAIPLPVADRGHPGAASSLIGLGRSSEDTGVQTLGIPLNPPQGGGFDLSTFPQFMWGTYRYQPGHVPGQPDPRGVGGSLVLTPWTQSALGSIDTGMRFSQFYSGAGLMQFSVAGKSRDRVAALFGYSDGDARGPSGSLSGRWAAGQVKGKYHLLGTRIDAVSRGSTTLPTPNARQLTARMIPVVQADFPLEGGGLVKTSFFYDGTYLRYDNPDTGFATRDQARQGGFESALLWREWKAGLGLRGASFQQTGFQAPSETIFNFHLANAYEAGSTFVEPTLQLTGVSRLGILPSASIGARRKLGEGAALFGRIGVTRRFPSLLDRYYVAPGFTGNPALKPERDWTIQLGGEGRGEGWSTSLQGYVQLREDAQLTLGVPTPSNSGTARVLAVVHEAGVDLFDGLELTHALNLASSRVTATGRAFPYLPRATEVLGLRTHGPGADPLWEARAAARLASSVTTPSGGQLGGYGFLDLSARGRLFGPGSGTFQSLDLSGRLENVFDRPIEFIEGYPTPGRVFSVALTGQF